MWGTTWSFYVGDSRPAVRRAQLDCIYSLKESGVPHPNVAHFATLEPALSAVEGVGDFD